jgi:hypothetical protein
MQPCMQHAACALQYRYLNNMQPRWCNLHPRNTSAQARRCTVPRCRGSQLLRINKPDASNLQDTLPADA